MRTVLIAVAALAMAFTWPAKAGSSSEGITLSLADSISGSRSAHRTKPLILNGIPNFRSTGSVGLIGFRPFDGLTIEAEFARQRTDNGLSDVARSRGFGALGQSRNGRLESVGTGVSLVHDLDPTGPLQPYVMGGLGASRLTESRGPADRVLTLTNRLVFDFQFGAGLAVSLDERVKLAAGYRFISNVGSFAGFDESSQEARKRDTSSHLFGVTVRLPFGEAD